MNSDWQHFLSSEQASFISQTQIVFPENQQTNKKRLIPIAELAVLSIMGKDAGTLLQGQITCNVNELSETQSSLGAMCNAKGRVITTFLIIKTPTAYLLVLPLELLAIVQKRLQLFILRSDATVIDCSKNTCLTGLYESQTIAEPLFATRQNKNIYVNFGQRYLIIAKVSDAIAYWQQKLQCSFTPTNSEEWVYADMLSGIPWLSVKSSEEYIPQMLNLEKLGGISFNKGCYTGQEVVARTHYLGKNKRALFLLDCASVTTAEPNDIIVDDSTGTEQVIGHVLVAKRNKLLAVLQLPVAVTQNLFLQNHPDCKLTLSIL